MRNLLLMMLVVAVLVGFAMMSEPATAAPKPSADLGVCPDSIGTNVILAEKADVGPPILAALLDARANHETAVATMEQARERYELRLSAKEVSAIHANETACPSEVLDVTKPDGVRLRDHAPC